MADDDERRRIGLQIVDEPERAFEVEIIGRLVEQQEVGRREQHRRERHPHAPAAGEFRQRAVLRRLVEAKAAEDPRRARRRGVGVDVDEARLDLGDALGVVGALGLGKQRRALLVGVEHEIDQRLARRPAPPARRGRAARAAGYDDRPALRRNLAADQPEERGLARAVAADEADARAVGRARSRCRSAGARRAGRSGR